MQCTPETAGFAGDATGFADGAAAAVVPPVAAAKRRVLLVDDEANILAALRRLLRREGYELLTATSAAEAVRLLESQPAQLVISDHRMPGMSGVELLQTIRGRWPETIRILLTGYSDVTTVIAAVNDGEIYKYLVKPWNDEEIRLHIRRALEQHELQDENRRMAREIARQNARLRELNALLEQRADDASTGLTSTQTLLEALGVGVLTVDPAGLVVAANRLAHDLLVAPGGELIGVSAAAALPERLRTLLDEAAPAGGASCRLELGGRRALARVSPLESAGQRRGDVVVLWEEDT